MRQLRIEKSILNCKDPSLKLYLDDISKVDLITAEEEVELARRIKKGDQASLEKLIKANLRFVVSIAKQYQNQGLSLPDLINEGNLGLMKAAEKFDETRGFKFISYAVWWIRQSILSALGEQSRIVRLPLNQVRFLDLINKISNKFEQENERKPSPEELADLTKMSADKVIGVLKNSATYFSLDRSFVEGEDNSLLDILSDKTMPDSDHLMMRDSLSKDLISTLATLTERESDILSLLYGIGCQEMTLESIGEKYGLDRERVWRIKQKAICRLRVPSRRILLERYL